MALAGAFFFGFVPMFLYAAFVNWLDRYEKEPKLLLGAAFVWGVVIAGGGAYILNTAVGIGVYSFTGSASAADFSTTSISAPIIEEALKGLAVLIVFLMFRKELILFWMVWFTAASQPWALPPSKMFCTFIATDIRRAAGKGSGPWSSSVLYWLARSTHFSRHSLESVWRLHV